MDTNNKNNTYNSLFHWHSFRLKLVFEGIAVGILTGFVVVLYRYALEEMGILLTEVYQGLTQRPILIPIWVCVLAVLGYSVGLMVKYEPMISGSGIPQVKGVLLRKLEMEWWKVILGKFIGGVLVIGTGLSMGREGPSVQLGAAVGQGFSKLFKRIKIEEKYLITSGASAGLAAAFNAPLAGVMFALEEIHKNFSPIVLLSALSAALSADFVSSQFFGLKPVFNFTNLTILPLRSYAYIVLLGMITGVLGVAFNKTILRTQDLYVEQKWLSKRFWIIIPLLISVVLGLRLPQVLGGGHELIVSLVTTGNFSLTILIVLLLVKFLFTMASFGSGAPGGIFLPLLAIGAIIGNVYGVVLVQFFHFESGFMSNFIILAMAGYFTAVVRAPITGTILITEMTGSFSHLLSLAVVSIVAYIVADLLGSKPIYESLLDRILHKQGERAVMGNEKTKSILEFAVCLGSMLDGKKIKEVTWPSDCLLVSVKRGEREIIPKGDTVIYPGDYLIVLTNEDRVSKINDIMIQMAHVN
ncbi:H(+)/Cl(-) exchange transporter ClcA [Desulfosporosinus sp. Sb-LF]|uniref:H(+)/Cl(-) exchange transporter ClcA n=1 Tax=Desulfosporosinus sp. Sb-LF TaxID=2560027 RepID=UPI00107F01D2|nr:H(+)/Cl(-) exchange transporter ClcA [Desulfosporosinus sp. Sb-LF]TGE32876.1 H(+)/Cl(-) exchange transporter ClcA [Desulfosporosinus sp. Sb-LF]